MVELRINPASSSRRQIVLFASDVTHVARAQPRDTRSTGIQPRIDIDSEQAWYWTTEWQDREAEAEADLAAGRYEDFNTVDDMLAPLTTPTDPA
jgi:hypothetical protein